ncbi:MAG: hypothetical protein MK175_21515 [Pseudoalteromonas sp.]|uniref:hypothetical protein n=1 Tax=Pseudoalteromonas sp. TaxID=53249 RepID=UPI0025F41826|nr:hypothetical protein [Pseudoalteromonas sp.]MCH2089766.1 hypothetical protein [Pseudoalteromonas sp.]
MPIKVRLDGFKKLAENAEKLDGRNTVNLAELLNDGFVSSHSNFKSFDDLLSASPFKATTPDEFDAIPNEQWDEYIAKVTNFDSWEDMQKRALDTYIHRKLFDGL